MSTIFKSKEEKAKEVKERALRIDLNKRKEIEQYFNDLKTRFMIWRELNIFPDHFWFAHTRVNKLTRNKFNFLDLVQGNIDGIDIKFEHGVIYFYRNYLNKVFNLPKYFVEREMSSFDFTTACSIGDIMLKKFGKYIPIGNVKDFAYHNTKIMFLNEMAEDYLRDASKAETKEFADFFGIEFYTTSEISIKTSPNLSLKKEKPNISLDYSILDEGQNHA